MEIFTSTETIVTYSLNNTGCEMQATGYRIPDNGHTIEDRDTGYRI